LFLSQTVQLPYPVQYLPSYKVPDAHLRTACYGGNLGTIYGNSGIFHEKSPLFIPKSKKTALFYANEYTSAVQPSIKPFSEAHYYSDPNPVIDLWLSVPRLLEVWLSRYYLIVFFIYKIM